MPRIQMTPRSRLVLRLLFVYVVVMLALIVIKFFGLLH